MNPPEPISEGPEHYETELHPRFTCRYCGHEHRSLTLKPYQKASCVQCGLVLAKGSRFGADTTVALIVTALLLIGPAMYLPFVTVAKLGSFRTGHLLSGAAALWAENMRLLSIWVAFCAGVVPLLMLIALAALTLPPRLGQSWPWTDSLRRTAIALEEWAMPEVYVLSVLVALTKLGSLVDVEIGPGFWCYVAMSVLLLLSWRNFRLGPSSFATPSSTKPALP